MKGSKYPLLQVMDVLKATGGVLCGGTVDGVFEGISSDSRDLIEGNLFIPLIGDKFNGHDFISDALNAGISGLLLQKGACDIPESVPAGVTVILVEDTLRALGDIANMWRKRFDIPVVAVTGSCGKTTTKEMISKVLELSGNVLKSRGNYNNLIGLPLSLLEINALHEMAVVEMGTNSRGEIARLAAIAEPNVGVITNIGPAHLEGFGSLEAVAEEKGSLFFNMRDNGVAVINRDDSFLRTLSDKWLGRNISFGIDENAFVRADSIFMRGERGISFTMNIGGMSKGIDMSVVGRHNIYNALACASACWAMEIPYDLICEGLSSFRQVKGRMDIYRLKNGSIVIDDTYNANPASVKEALITMGDLKGKNESIVFLGDMLELGEDTIRLHEEVGRAIADTGVGTLFLKGEFSESVAKGAIDNGFRRENIYFSDEPEFVMEVLHKILRDGDWILIKGSRRMKMEEFLHAIVGTFG